MAVSPLGAARLRRRLTLEEAAARAHMEVDQVKSLEENCMYRFGSNADALAAALVYATALRISEREARQIAGLPTASRFVDPFSIRRTMAVFAFLAAASSLMWFGFRPEFGKSGRDAAATPAVLAVTPAGKPLPQPWEIQVDVFNGTKTGNAAASMANDVAGLAYGIGKVGDANRPDYAKTLVYYPPGAEAIAKRLAKELGVGTAALPGGDNPNRLVVIVGKGR
jgi:LytR cell envelope-related transcriptional attenuator